MKTLEQLKEMCNTKEAEEEHRNNVLHRFCRSVDSLVHAGYEHSEAYSLMKKRYKLGKENS